MPINEIEKDLQRKDSKAAQRKHDKTVYNVWESKEEKVESGTWQKMKDKMFGTRVRAITFGGIVIAVIVVILLATISFVHFQRNFFSTEKVNLDIIAPQSIDSNTMTEIVFVYENKNRARLNDAQIVVHFGDHFIPDDNQESFVRSSDTQGILKIGKISGHKKGKLVLTGHFIAPAGTVSDISGVLQYTPNRISARYETQARSTTTIMSSPLTIDIKAPQEIVSGNLLDASIVIKNSSKDELTNIKMILDIPKTFSLYDIKPSPIRGNTVLINSIKPQGEYIITMRGTIKAQMGTAQPFHIEVGTQEGDSEYILYAQADYTPRIIGSPIIVKQIIESDVENNVVKAGQNLRYHITFTNNGSVPLRDAIVVTNFDTNVLDFSKLELDGKGDFDEENKRIIWKASDVNALKLLKPQESGNINFTVPVLENLPVKTKNDHHFSVTTVTYIDSEDIPSALRENKTVLSNVLTLKVAAKVLLNSQIKYEQGANPLKVGEKTVFSVNLELDNINNDIDKTVVHIPLPTYMHFEGSDSQKIKYNERTNEIIWNVGAIEHGVGVLSEKIKETFDTSIIPSVDQVDSAPILIKEQTLTADDLFTQTQVKVIVAPVTLFSVQGISGGDITQ